MLGVYARAFFTTYILKEGTLEQPHPSIDYAVTRPTERALQLLRLTEAFPAYYVSSAGNCHAAFFGNRHVMAIRRSQQGNIVLAVFCLIFAIPAAIIATVIKIALLISDPERRNRYFAVVNYLKPKPRDESDFSSQITRPLPLFPSKIPEETLAKICHHLDFTSLIRLSRVSKAFHVYFTKIYAPIMRATFEMPDRPGMSDAMIVKQTYNWVVKESPPQILQLLKFNNLVRMFVIPSVSAFNDSQIQQHPIVRTQKSDFFAFRCTRTDTNERGYITFAFEDMHRQQIVQGGDWVNWVDYVDWNCLDDSLGIAYIGHRDVSFKEEELKKFFRGETITVPIHPSLLFNNFVNRGPTVSLRIDVPLSI